MAIGSISNFQIYNVELHTAMTEVIAQVVDLFNASSGGAIVLRQDRGMGDYKKESFFANIADLVGRRIDTDTTTGLTDKALAQSERVKVKLKRRVEPVAVTLDALEESGFYGGADVDTGNSEFSFMLGQQIGAEIAQKYLDAAVMAVNAAIGSQATIIHDYSATGDITHGQINVANAKLGDRSSRIKTYVMYSKVYHDLIGQAMTDKVVEVANVAIVSGSTFGLGRRIVVADVADLFNATPTPDQYTSLGLVENAVEVIQDRPLDLIAVPVTGLPNLITRIQGEYSFTVGVKGFTWDVTNGGRNPTDTALGTTTNWDKVCTDLKNGPGVKIITQ